MYDIISFDNNLGGREKQKNLTGKFNVLQLIHNPQNFWGRILTFFHEQGTKL